MLALNPSCVIRVVPLAENGTVFGTTFAGTRRRAVAPFALSMYGEVAVRGIFPFLSKVIAHWLVVEECLVTRRTCATCAVVCVVTFAGDVLALDPLSGRRAHSPLLTSARVCAPTVGIVHRHAVEAVALSSVVVSALY
jgi:hypothetical protein